LKEIDTSYNLKELTQENYFGVSFGKFINAVPQNNYMFEGVRLSKKLSDIALFKKRSQDIAKMILFNLNSKFKDTTFIKNLKSLT